MSKSFLTTFVHLAVRSTGKPSNTAARNAGVSIIRALSTSAISEPASRRLYVSGFHLRDECEAAILLNIENANKSNDEEYVTDHIAKAFELMGAMKGSFMSADEEIYGPLLNFLIGKKMVEEFHMLVEAIRGDGESEWLQQEKLARLCYYKMLLWIKLKDEEKIEEVCSMIIKSFKAKITKEENPLKPTIILRRGWRIHRVKLCDKKCPSSIENYLLALCDKDQHKEVLRILESLDITRVDSFGVWTSIFKHLGRFLSEPVAKKLLRELYKSAFLISKELLKELKIPYSFGSYKKLIKYSCDSREEQVGLSILLHMYALGLEVPSGYAVNLFRTIEKNYGFDLVLNLQYLIMCVQLRGAQDVLKEMEKKGEESIMFNQRLAEYILEVTFSFYL
ncbi:hypothetical protein CARUB_v10021602mg [Capsella rubella]|uniref:Pentacotripeptide-repeat region of PRORP domain-containing protein n=1 Tax=Capsella rubella TaxID=81985 RepID=R0GEN7_9BRAS|nr:hypothetical protein CARUB_v10021602mg [Capsella rubella]